MTHSLTSLHSWNSLFYINSTKIGKAFQKKKVLAWGIFEVAIRVHCGVHDIRTRLVHTKRLQKQACTNTKKEKIWRFKNIFTTQQRDRGLLSQPWPWAVFEFHFDMLAQNKADLAGVTLTERKCVWQLYYLCTRVGGCRTVVLSLHYERMTTNEEIHRTAYHCTLTNHEPVVTCICYHRD